MHPPTTQCPIRIHFVSHVNVHRRGNSLFLSSVRHLRFSQSVVAPLSLQRAQLLTSISSTQMHRLRLHHEWNTIIQQFHQIENVLVQFHLQTRAASIDVSRTWIPNGIAFERELGFVSIVFPGNLIANRGRRQINKMRVSCVCHMSWNCFRNRMRCDHVPVFLLFLFAVNRFVTLSTFVNVAIYVFRPRIACNRE